MSMNNRCENCVHNQNGRCQSSNSGYRGTYITSIDSNDKANCSGYRR